MVFLMPLIGYSQSKPPIVIWYQDQTRYCLTESQALAVVELDLENDIHKGKVIDLTAKVELLQDQLTAKDTIQSASNELLAIEGERLSMTKKELRKEKRKAIGQWFKDSYDKILIGVGGVSLGIGVGYLAK